MDKQKYLDIAEVLDAHRIFPKLFMLLSWGCAIYVGYWYTGLEIITPEATAFAGIVAGALAKAQDYYFRGGRNWTKSDST